MAADRRVAGSDANSEGPALSTVIGAAEHPALSAAGDHVIADADIGRPSECAPGVSGVLFQADIGGAGNGPGSRIVGASP